MSYVKSFFLWVGIATALPAFGFYKYAVELDWNGTSILLLGDYHIEHELESKQNVVVDRKLKQCNDQGNTLVIAEVRPDSCEYDVHVWHEPIPRWLEDKESCSDVKFGLCDSTLSFIKQFVHRSMHGQTYEYPAITFLPADIRTASGFLLNKAYYLMKKNSQEYEQKKEENLNNAKRIDYYQLRILADLMIKTDGELLNELIEFYLVALMPSNYTNDSAADVLRAEQYLVEMICGYCSHYKNDPVLADFFAGSLTEAQENYAQWERFFQKHLDSLEEPAALAFYNFIKKQNETVPHTVRHVYNNNIFEYAYHQLLDQFGYLRGAAAPKTSDAGFLALILEHASGFKEIICPLGANHIKVLKEVLVSLGSRVVQERGSPDQEQPIEPAVLQEFFRLPPMSYTEQIWYMLKLYWNRWYKK